MARKISLILFLAVLLAAFLVLRPYIFGSKETPTIQDRLPDADFMARAKVLDLAKEISGMLYYYKVPYREFLSEEFILAQAKTYGLQVQNPCYLFANDDGTWGGLAEITDSAKVAQGIDKLRHLFATHDTLIANRSVLAFDEFDGFIDYDHDYIFFFFGAKPKKYIERVAAAKVDQVSPNWRTFLNHSRYMDKNLVICSVWKELKEATIDQALAYPIIDSTHISLYTHFKSKDTLPVKLKNYGYNLKDGEFTSKLANIHVDASKLKENPAHPLYRYLVKQGKRVGFPTNEFIQVWGGDLSFRQGGLFTVQEKYIESELDENFNVTEVVKYRAVKVPGFSLLYSVNSKGEQFYRQLLRRGVLTEQENKFYFLFSPPLRLKKTPETHLFYSSQYPPKTTMDSTSHVNWTYKGTEYKLVIDSMNTFEFFGSLRFPMGKILDSKNLSQ